MFINPANSFHFLKNMQQSFWINPPTGEQVFLPAGWRIKPKIPGARWAVYKKRQLQFYFGIESNHVFYTYLSGGSAEWFYLWIFPYKRKVPFYVYPFAYWKKARFCGHLFYKADGAAIKDKSDRFIHYRYEGEDDNSSQMHFRAFDVYGVNFYFQWRVKAKRTKESRDLCRRIIDSFLYDGRIYRLQPGRLWINLLQEKPVHMPDGWEVQDRGQLFMPSNSFREYRLRKKRYNFYMSSYYDLARSIDNSWLESSDAYGPAVLEHAQWKQEEFAEKPVEISHFAASIATGEAVEGYIIRRFKGRLRWALKIWGPKGICEDSEVRRLAEDLSATSMPD